ncbi:MAG: glycosyltransferase family 4 protein [Bryobacterales bacterium]|nr:glycosyltransferase family 4 protein [Bryobacterales bacterium]
MAIDATYSLGANLSGVGVYSREVIRAIAAAHPGQRFLWCYRTQRYLRSWQEPMPANCRRRLLFESRVPRCALFHGLNQRLPEVGQGRSVVTFHDLFVLTGEYSSAEFRTRFSRQAREAAERADRIICVSAFTATQVRDLLHVPESKLRVVWHGVHCPRSLFGDAGRRPVVLHVGAVQARKNIVRLVEAFETMPSPWRLILAGSAGYGAEAILKRIESSPARQRIELTGYVDDDRLAELYRTSRMLAFPSLDEGFGIPLLEAMAYGLPALTSNGSALREVAEGAAVLVDPRRTEEISAAMQDLASDEGLRKRLVAAGLEKAKANSWGMAAEKTWAVYEELLGKSFAGR